MLVGGLEDGLQAEYIGGAGQTDDALAPIRQVLDQLEGARAYRKQVFAPVAGVVQAGPGFEGEDRKSNV